MERNSSWSEADHIICQTWWGAMLLHEPIRLPLEPRDKHLLIISLLIEAELILKCTGLYSAQILPNAAKWLDSTLQYKWIIIQSKLQKQSNSFLKAKKSGILSVTWSQSNSPCYSVVKCITERTETYKQVASKSILGKSPQHKKPPQHST